MPGQRRKPQFQLFHSGTNRWQALRKIGKPRKSFGRLCSQTDQCVDYIRFIRFHRRCRGILGKRLDAGADLRLAAQSDPRSGSSQHVGSGAVIRQQGGFGFRWSGFAAISCQ